MDLSNPTDLPNPPDPLDHLDPPHLMHPPDLLDPLDLLDPPDLLHPPDLLDPPDHLDPLDPLSLEHGEETIRHPVPIQNFSAKVNEIIAQFKLNLDFQSLFHQKPHANK